MKRFYSTRVLQGLSMVLRALYVGSFRVRNRFQKGSLRVLEDPKPLTLNPKPKEFYKRSIGFPVEGSLMQRVQKPLDLRM